MKQYILTFQPKNLRLRMKNDVEAQNSSHDKAIKLTEFGQLKKIIKKKVNYSILKSISLNLIISTVWSIIWTYLILNKITPWAAFSPFLITVLSIVVGLLLVFRTNTA
jgi:predicted membrane chloride channel (bestrophin family)